MNSVQSLEDWIKAYGYSEIQSSSVLVTFNRRFTWAEREHLRSVVDGMGWTHRVTPSNTAKVSFSGDSPSRELFEVISYIVEHDFVNMFPRSVKTLSPETKV